MSKILRDPDMTELLKRHFWCDFSDLIPHMKWDGLDQKESGADKAPRILPRTEE